MGNHDSSVEKRDAATGCILGTAVGDAIGLPYEGFSKRRLHRVHPDITGYALCFGRGMVSDDTEQTCMVAQSLIVSGGDPARFLRSLSWRLRFWLLGLPTAVGFGTLRAILRLWLGFSPERSGVYSAGNGPATRSAIIGVSFGHDTALLRRLVQTATRLTHTDRKAEYGAYAVALAAYMAGNTAESQVDPREYSARLRESLDREASELVALVDKAVDSVVGGEPTDEFAKSLGFGEGVTGYVYSTVPVVIHAWLSHQDEFRSAVLAVVRCGGDTDTTAAIVGGIVGASVGKRGIPEDWLDGLCEWPRSVAWMEELGVRLATVANSQTVGRALRISKVGLLLRNIFFLIVVLFHACRRLLPPY
jgi:ADP-ribosylglycohydrolase